MISNLRLALLLLVSLLFASVAPAAEPSPLPRKFQARLGGFLGAAYAVELRDGVLRYSERKRGGPNSSVTTTITPTAGQWRAFRQSLDGLDVWRWRPEYMNRGVLDGTQWSLEIEYSDHSLKTMGSNDYPDESGASAAQTGVSTAKSFDRFIAAVETLLGGRAFR